MTHRTVVIATYDDYLASEFPRSSANAVAARTADLQEHQARLFRFPHSVVLQVAYPELDFANRWCWQQWGAAHGECQQVASEYSACQLPAPHAHEGRWSTHWLAKTDYDFGFNVWCFAHIADHHRFLEWIPSIHWGEHYPR